MCNCAHSKTHFYLYDFNRCILLLAVVCVCRGTAHTQKEQQKTCMLLHGLLFHMRSHSRTENREWDTLDRWLNEDKTKWLFAWCDWEQRTIHTRRAVTVHSITILLGIFYSRIWLHLHQLNICSVCWTVFKCMASLLLLLFVVFALSAYIAFSWCVHTTFFRSLHYVFCVYTLFLDNVIARSPNKKLYA